MTTSYKSYDGVQTERREFNTKKFAFKCGECGEVKPGYQFYDAKDGSKCRVCDDGIHQYQCNGACNKMLDSNQFTKSQLRKRNRKCKKCTQLLLNQ